MKRLGLIPIIILLTLARAAPVSARIEIGGYLVTGYADLEGSGAQGVLPRTAPQGGVNVNPALGAAVDALGNAGGEGTFHVSEAALSVTAPLSYDLTVRFDLNASRLGAVRLRRAYVDWHNPGFVDLNLRAGRIHSVLGIESKEMEPIRRRNLSLSLLAPYTAGEITGVNLYGSIKALNYSLAAANGDPAGAASVMNTASAAGNAPAAAIGNGLGGTPNTAPGTLGRTPLADGRNTNTGLALGGRLSIMPMEFVEVGASGSYGDYANGAGESIRSLFALDLRVLRGPLRFTAEWLRVNEEIRQTAAGADPFANAEAEGWYAEILWDLPLWGDRTTFYLRYESMNLNGPQTLAAGAGRNGERAEIFDGRAWTAALARDLAPGLRAVIEYQRNDESRSGPVDPNPAGTHSNLGDVENDVLSAAIAASF